MRQATTVSPGASELEHQIAEGVARLNQALGRKYAESYREHGDVLLHERGETRLVKQNKSLIQDQADKGRVSTELLDYANTFCAKLAGRLGYAVEDWQDSTHRGIPAYDGIPVSAGSYGPRSPSVYQLDCGQYVRAVYDRFPPEQLGDFQLLIEQHAQFRAHLPMSVVRRLRDMGADIGFDPGKQKARAEAAAAMRICCMLLNLKKFMNDLDKEIAKAANRERSRCTSSMGKSGRNCPQELR